MIAFLGVLVRLGAMAGVVLLVIGSRAALQRARRRAGVRRGLAQLESPRDLW